MPYMHLLAAAALLAQPGDKPVPVSAGALISGTYAERNADGSSGCGNEAARQLVLRVLDRPPHYRSENIGEIDYALGETGGGFYLSGQPVLGLPDAEGGRTVTVSGGVINAVSRYIDGIPDSSLRGHFRGEFRLTANGDMEILDLRFDDRWQLENAEEVDVREGRLPGGTRLRPFGRCDAER